MFESLSIDIVNGFIIKIERKINFLFLQKKNQCVSQGYLILLRSMYFVITGGVGGIYIKQ